MSQFSSYFYVFTANFIVCHRHYVLCMFVCLHACIYASLGRVIPDLHAIHF